MNCASAGAEGEPEQAACEDEQRCDQRGLDADAGDDRGGYAGDDHQRARERELGESSGERVVGEDGLHVDREGEEQRDHGCADEEHDDVADGQIAVAEYFERHEWFSASALDDHERDSEDDRGQGEADRERVREADLLDRAEGADGGDES